MVFEKGRGLRDGLPGRRFGDASDGDDGGGSSLTNTVDPRRGNRGAVAVVEPVGDDADVVELVPEWSNQNFVTYRQFVLNSKKKKQKKKYLHSWEEMMCSTRTIVKFLS